MRSTRSLGTILGILALGASLACGGGDSASDEASQAASTPTPAAEAPAPPEPDIDFGEDDSIEGLEIVQGELPKGYPSDLPSYPEAEPVMSMLVPGKGGLVGFSSPDPASDVFAFYQDQLAEQGWKVESTGEKPLSILSSKGERKASIKIARVGDNTEILITLSGS